MRVRLSLILMFMNTNNCKYCDAKKIREGNSLHCWSIEYECGGSIVGTIDSADGEDYKLCSIKEYVLQGGELFKVTKMHKEGRSTPIKSIVTTKGTYYVDLNTGKVYPNYGLENEVSPLLKKYVIDRVQAYIKGCEGELHINKSVLDLIKKNG